MAPKAASFLQELCSRTRQGTQLLNADALADMRPQLAELMRDGALLTLNALRQSYAKMSCALCKVCCSSLELHRGAESSAPDHALLGSR